MKRFLIVFIVLAPFFMFAAIGDNGISVDSEGNKLKWEEGRWDFFIMHKSLVKKVTGEEPAMRAIRRPTPALIRVSVRLTLSLRNTFLRMQISTGRFLYGSRLRNRTI